MRRNAEEKSEAARIPILKCKGFWTVINAQRTKRRSKDAESAAAAQFRSERNLQFRTNYFTFRNSGLEKLAAGGGRGRRSSTGGRGLRRSNDFCMCGLAAGIPSFSAETPSFCRQQRAHLKPKSVSANISADKRRSHGVQIRNKVSEALYFLPSLLECVDGGACMPAMDADFAD